MRIAIIYALAILSIALSFVTPVFAQGSPVNVTFSASAPLPIGQTTTVSVLVTDVSNSTAQLIFVGVHFEWSRPDAFFIGGNSEKGAVLAAGQQVTYPIPVQIPSNVTPGIHKMTAYVSYRWLRNGSWTGTIAGFWESNIGFAYPQVASQTTPTSTTQPPAQPMFDTSTLETAGVLIAVVAIGLFLERGRIKKVAKKLKPQRTSPETTSETPKTDELPVQEKREEDL